MGDIFGDLILGLMLFVFISTFIVALVFSIIDNLKNWYNDHITSSFIIAFFVSLIYFLIISFQVGFDYKSSDFLTIKEIFSKFSIFYLVFIGISSLFSRWITAWFVFLIGEICQKK